jgi:hypothetical protein
VVLRQGVISDYVDVSVLQGTSGALSSWLWSFISAVPQGLAFLVLFLLMRVIFRRPRIASVAFVALAPFILVYAPAARMAHVFLAGSLS